MASNIQDDENAENLLISSYTDMELNCHNYLTTLSMSHICWTMRNSTVTMKVMSLLTRKHHKSVKNPKLLPPTSNLIFILPACHKMKVHASITESVLVCGHKIQGVFKEYSSTKNRVFKGNSKQVYFVLNYDLNFAICHYRLQIAAPDMKCILIKRKP